MHKTHFIDQKKYAKKINIFTKLPTLNFFQPLQETNNIFFLALLHGLWNLSHSIPPATHIWLLDPRCCAWGSPSLMDQGMRLFPIASSTYLICLRRSPLVPFNDIIGVVRLRTGWGEGLGWRNKRLEVLKIEERKKEKKEINWLKTREIKQLRMQY